MQQAVYQSIFKLNGIFGLSERKKINDIQFLFKHVNDYINCPVILRSLYLNIF